jgi:hypothetical protein
MTDELEIPMPVQLDPQAPAQPQPQDDEPLLDDVEEAYYPIETFYTDD